jgi:hypothetical protein
MLSLPMKGGAGAFGTVTVVACFAYRRTKGYAANLAHLSG